MATQRTLGELGDAPFLVDIKDGFARTHVLAEIGRFVPRPT